MLSFFESQILGLRTLLRENFVLTSGVGQRIANYCDNLEESFKESEINSRQGAEYYIKYKELVEAVRWIYYAARWTPDRSVDGKEGNMWARLRDAAGFEKGKSPKPIETIYRRSDFAPSITPGYVGRLEFLNRKLNQELELKDGAVKEISLLNKQQAETIKKLQEEIKTHRNSQDIQRDVINNQSTKIADLSKASDLDAKTIKHLRDEMERYQALLSEEGRKLRKLKEVLNG